MNNDLNKRLNNRETMLFMQKFQMAKNFPWVRMVSLKGRLIHEGLKLAFLYYLFDKK